MLDPGTAEPLWASMLFARFIQYALVYLVVYAGLDRLTTSQDDRPEMHDRKYDPRVPPLSLMQGEAMRGLGSVIMVTLMEIGMARLQFLGVPIIEDVDFLGASSERLDMRTVAILGAAFAVWGEFHFYFTHRLLHGVDFLYRHVHSVHHLSKNTDAWSGLSFHPVEALLYFSAFIGWTLVPLFTAGHVAVPHLLVRASVIGLIVTPALIHQGHDLSPVDEQRASRWYKRNRLLRKFFPHPYHHYLHHKLVVCNFGGFSLWDELLGTHHREEDVSANALND